MRVDWVPFSASALVVGAVALSVGALVAPEAGMPASPLGIIEGNPTGWPVVSGLYAVASISLILGVPAVLSIFDVRGARAALVGASLLVVGCIGTAAYAVLLAVYRALADGDLLLDGARDLAADRTLMAVLYVWVFAFALGELVIALALVRAQRVPRWVPGLLVLHVGLSPLAPVLPGPVAAVVALTVTFAFAALGIVANQRTQLV